MTCQKSCKNEAEEKVIRKQTNNWFLFRQVNIKISRENVKIKKKDIGMRLLMVPKGNY